MLSILPLNFTFQIVQRLTTTDYIDDVSTTYVGNNNFPASPGGQPSIASLLQDRSYATGPPIGNPGVPKGRSSQKAQYMTAEMGISFNLRNCNCPTEF